jgi:hypothetical protein
MARKSIVIMDGEVSGHCHRAEGEDIELLTKEDIKILNAPHGATITHEEHSVIKLPPGEYRVGRVQEYDYDLEERRAVSD